MTSTTMTEITQLSVAERIQLAEDIWDSIVAEPDALALTEPQRAELGRRLAAFPNPLQSASSWDDVKKRVADQ